MPAGAAAGGGTEAGTAGELGLLYTGDAAAGELAVVATTGAGAGVPATRPTLPGCGVVKATWGTVTAVLRTDVVVQPGAMLAVAALRAEPESEE